MFKSLLTSILMMAMMAGGIFSSAAVAAETNPHIVHRQGTFKVISGHMSSLAALLFYGGNGDANYHAKGIEDALSHLGDAFPEGSDFGETRAKASIWENMDDFNKKRGDAENAAGALVAAVAGGDKGATIEAFKALGGTCKACHQDYREK